MKERGRKCRICGGRADGPFAKTIAPAHSAVSAVLFFADKRTPVTEPPPYLLDLAPRDFFRFPKIKSIYINRNVFQCLEEVKVRTLRTAKLLKALPLDELQHYFEEWKIRMQRCVGREEERLKGTDVKLGKLLNKTHCQVSYMGSNN